MLLWIPTVEIRFNLRDYYSILSCFPAMFDYQISIPYWVLTPQILLPMVWALAISLTTTLAIVITFFSSGYLDVSVLRVPLITVCIRVMIL